MHASVTNPAPQRTRSPKPDRNRGRVEVVADLCKGCLLCIEACPPACLTPTETLNHLGYHPVAYTGADCTGCGICFYVCPEPGALRVFKRVSTVG
ncbi:MAG: 4Fe-4S dicluster domain-containing protein [Kiloniellales bacterium]|nr:4Fe-4S dicluster domain-containing protein [Kiloniellales bacterium]